MENLNHSVYTNKNHPLNEPTEEKPSDQPEDEDIEQQENDEPTDEELERNRKDGWAIYGTII